MKYNQNLKLFQTGKDTGERLYKELFQSAWEEEPDTAVRNLFFAGDLHHGKAASSEFEAGIDILCRISPSTVNKLAQIIPEYGSWDNLLVLLHHEETKNEAVHLFLGRINADINLIQERRPCSPFSVCMPDENTKDGNMLAEAFHLKRNSYQTLLDMLRQKADIPEQKTDFSSDWTKMNEEEMLETLKKYNRITELMNIS